MFDELFQGSAIWFSIPALLGTGVFAVRLALMLFGSDVDTGDADVSGFEGDGALDGSDSDQAFTVLSIQGTSAFLMGFGWTGLGALMGAGWEVVPSLALGLVGGIAMAWLLILMLRAVHDLQSSGTLSIDAALGEPGEVYVTVPGHQAGRGQIKLVIGDRQRIFDAVTSGDALPTRTRVRVIAVNDDRTLTVGAA